MKKIIHIDADCFFAAVELLNRPYLKDKPVGVGGDPSGRGVIATCNYEARKYGVCSAMSSAEALRLCPSILLLKPNMPLYREYSQCMMNIFGQYSDQVETVSLDEAYIDVSFSDKNRGSATLITREIMSRVKREIGISVSAGVAPIKFLAKVASDWNKPGGLFTITPQMLPFFLAELPVKKIPGVGKVTQNRLAKYGIQCCADIEEAGLDFLLKQFGTFGHKLYMRAKGVDDRPVKPRDARKSISVERTFSSDIVDTSMVNTRLSEVLEQLSERVARQARIEDPVKFFVKVKFSDFSQTTKEAVIPKSLLRKWGTGNRAEFVSTAAQEFQRLAMVARSRNPLPVRLLGVGLRLSCMSGEMRQLNLPLDG
ncbi:DNA polymerase IV [Teredinibacter sp. KSP-S5-2]|uniref:DNA polymerase IV n=1 Tax=Teredinibacter sp. KSP-S5-2 TaxID=3034506 RepID=UPI002934BA4F|nr:DNA polymerase IV [Teredinibacter sp. KSP-S5-2]WNO10156.1 DNA polymerase IV [Teredinibacter sp. KSP-S5-2]